MLNIIIADDHPLIREGFKRILHEEPDLHVQGEASSGDELFQLVRGHRPDMVILDLTMPGKHGLDIIKELKLEFPSLPVLIVSMHPEDRFAVRAIRLGASAYLTKDSAPYELVKAIRKVIGGERYITPSVGAQLARAVGGSGKQSAHESLSNREMQVLCLLASGKSTNEIAKDLCISINTVNTYRTRILEKLNLKSNVDLTLYAVRNKLIE